MAYVDKRKVTKSGTSLTITINQMMFPVEQGEMVKVTYKSGKMIVERCKDGNKD